MKSADYWQRRAEASAKIQHVKADDYIERLSKEYDKAIASINHDIEAFYGRFAVNNQISFLDAKRTLDKGELKEFRMTLEEFTKLAKNNTDGQWTKVLNNVYYKTRVSRLEALLIQVRQQAELLAGSEHSGVTELLKDTYKEGYYRTLYEIQKGTGLGTSFAKIDDKALNQVLNSEWAGSNYSKRIWGDRDKLVREIQTNLTQAFIRGDSLNQVTRKIQDRLKVSKSNATRLVRTESAFIAGEATYAGYKESGIVKQYQFLATLDTKTSSICRDMDDQVFDLSDKEVGVNWPPLHAHCRSTTVPYFGDEDLGERTAKGKDGQTYYVPDNLSYDSWKKQYVDSPKNDIIEPNQRATKFESLLGKTPNVDSNYKDALTKRFDSGNPTAQRVFLEYVKDNAVANSSYKKTAHYDPNGRVINMDFGADLDNPRGPGATYFHEFGHYVDNMAATRLVGKPTIQGVCHIDLDGIDGQDFRKAILDDVQNYIVNYAKQNKVTTREAQLMISSILSQGNGALHSAVSDIFGGATGLRVRGLYGHPAQYWKQLPYALEKETFAHMFEASFDSTGERLNLIKEFLPSSYEVFIRILEAI